MPPNILTPAAALVVWTLVMFLWMAATRGPALKKLGTDELKPGARGSDLEPLLDERVNWKAHNYAHLHEQPTVFYAAVLILALAGYTTADVLLAWAYVALRVIHSVSSAKDSAAGSRDRRRLFASRPRTLRAAACSRAASQGPATSQ